MPTRKNHTIEKTPQEYIVQKPPLEICREIDYGSGKTRLILQFPPEPSIPHPENTLREEIRSMLSRELSEQLQCRKQEPSNSEYRGPEPMPQTGRKAFL